MSTTQTTQRRSSCDWCWQHLFQIYSPQESQVRCWPAAKRGGSVCSETDHNSARFGSSRPASVAAISGSWTLGTFRLTLCYWSTTTSVLRNSVRCFDLRFVNTRYFPPYPILLVYYDFGAAKQRPLLRCHVRILSIVSVIIYIRRLIPLTTCMSPVRNSLRITDSL